MLTVGDRRGRALVVALFSDDDFYTEPGGLALNQIQKPAKDVAVLFRIDDERFNRVMMADEFMATEFDDSYIPFDEE